MTRTAAVERIFASAYAPFNQALRDALGPVEGLTVLDVGCGTGALTWTVIDGGGTAVGVDISESAIATARKRVPEARFVVADAQAAPLHNHAPNGFDVIASDFGVMFFDDPEAAFANLAAATKPGGRLVFQCWRSFDENPTFTNGIHLLRERLPDPPPLYHAAAGPTRLADPSYTEAVLADAGWVDIRFSPFDAMLRFGLDGSDGVEERMAVILSLQTGRQACEQLPSVLGEDGWQAFLDEVRVEVAATKVDGVVAFRGATWIVVAAKPA